MIKKMLLFVVLVVMVLFVWNLFGKNDNVEATSATEKVLVPSTTPTTDPVLAKERACTVVHHGHTYTVPYTYVDTYTMYAVNNIVPTEFAYTYKNLDWKMGATCYDSPGPFPPRAHIVFDMPISPKNNTSISCSNTDIVISGIEVVSSKCDFDQLTLVVPESLGGLDQEVLYLKLVWTVNHINDTYSKPWRLNYQFIGNHSDGTSSNLECKWITRDDYNNSTYGMNLTGKEKGFFDFNVRSETSVICAGDGYTVSMVAR